MSMFCEFKKTSSDRSVFINSSQIVMVSSGSDRESTTLELAGQRSFEVRGTIAETIAVIDGSN